MKLADYENRIKQLARYGRPFGEIEEIIDDAPLNDGQKAALWLLAWSFTDPVAQRRIAREALAAVS